MAPTNASAIAHRSDRPETLILLFECNCGRIIAGEGYTIFGGIFAPLFRHFCPASLSRPCDNFVGRRRAGGRPRETLVKRIGLLFAVIVMSGLPTLAQTDIIGGMWRPLARNEDGSGMDGDYAGLPLSPAGRLRAQSWAPENFDVPEMVCRPHSWDFSLEAGAAQMRFTPEIDDPTQTLTAY